MAHEIRIEQQPALQIAVVRRRARREDLPRIVPESCGLVWKVVRAQKVAGAGRHIAVFRDDVINLEVGVEVTVPFAGHGEVVGSSTPSGPAATTTHLGPYQQLHLAHEAIRSWAKANAHELAGPNWEIYDHWKDEWRLDPSKIRTDVYYLLARQETRGK